VGSGQTIQWILPTVEDLNDLSDTFTIVVTCLNSDFFLFVQVTT